TETHDAITADQNQRRITTTAATVNTFNGSKNILRRWRHFANLLQLMGKNVQQNFGVGIGIGMAQIFGVKLFSQLCCVGQVAVMSQAKTVGRIYIKRLGQCRAGAAGGWITHMTYAHASSQAAHMAGAEYILDQSVVLTQIEDSVITGCNTGSILPSVLQHRQRVIQRNRDIGSGNNAN